MRIFARYVGWAVLALMVGAGVAAIVLAVQAHERDLDRRCAAVGGRRVQITDEKLCFTEDWRWVKI